MLGGLCVGAILVVALLRKTNAIIMRAVVTQGMAYITAKEQ
jgi:hypothetical protein